MTDRAKEELVRPRRIVLTDGRSPYVERLSASLVELGNRVVRRDLDPRSAVSELDEDGPELVVVVAGDDREEALRLIGFVRHERQLPVVAAIEHADIEWTVAAVSAGACGAVIGAGPESVRAAVHAACEHFAELRRLEEALERRAVIERAKGVLMATRGIGGEDAYILLRDHSRRTNQKLVRIADGILRSHVLLGKQHTRPTAETASIGAAPSQEPPR